MNDLRTDPVPHAPGTGAIGPQASPSQEPSARLRAHLQEVHENAAGFTEACAGTCRDADGRNSYEWLAEAASPVPGGQVLDLACGSGVLLELCRARYGSEVELIGLDMSPHELELARERLAGTGVVLHRGLAQSLDFAADGALDAVLCHWALTLMDPLEPVLAEIERVLKPGGTFAAIVDGPEGLAPGYDAVSELIGTHVAAEHPDYGELGDPRARDGEALQALARSHFIGGEIALESQVVSMSGAPERLAAEASGFFYSAFSLSGAQRAKMLEELTGYFARQSAPRFDMPISRLLVRK